MRLRPFTLLSKITANGGSTESLQQRMDRVQEENAVLRSTLVAKEEDIAVLSRENESLRKYIEPLEAEVERARSMISAEWGELCDEETNILLAVVQTSGGSHAELAALYHVTEERIYLVLDDLRVKGMVDYGDCSSVGRGWKATPKGLRYLADRGILP